MYVIYVCTYVYVCACKQVYDICIVVYVTCVTCAYVLCICMCCVYVCEYMHVCDERVCVPTLTHNTHFLSLSSRC